LTTGVLPVRIWAVRIWAARILAARILTLRLLLSLRTRLALLTLLTLTLRTLALGVLRARRAAIGTGRALVALVALRARRPAATHHRNGRGHNARVGQGVGLGQGGAVGGLQFLLGHLVQRIQHIAGGDARRHGGAIGSAGRGGVAALAHGCAPLGALLRLGLALGLALLRGNLLRLGRLLFLGGWLRRSLLCRRLLRR
jgi:hypothetical protein